MKSRNPEFARGIGVLLFIALMTLTHTNLAAQTPPPLSQGSGINSADTYLVADITIQSQATLLLTSAVHDNRTNTDTTSPQFNPPAKHFHIEAGYDTNDHLVFNMYPTDPPADPTTSLTDFISKAQVTNGQVTVFDTSGNPMPSGIPQNPQSPSPRSPAPPQPFWLLGAMPGPTVLGYLITSSPAQLASSLGGTAQTVQTGPPAINQVTIPIHTRGGGTVALTYQSTGSAWILQQVALSRSSSTMQATSSIQIANLNWIQNSAGDARRAGLAPTAQPAPASSTMTIQTPALYSPSTASTQVQESFTSAAQNVVFQHGIFSTADTWSRMEGWLNPTFEFGHEITPTLPSCFTIPILNKTFCGLDRLADQGTDLANVLNNSGQNDFVLIGHSQGGLISRDVAQRRPDLALGAITLDTPHLGALIDLTGRLPLAAAVADLIDGLAADAGCTSPGDNLACALADFLANFSFFMVNFALDSAIPATEDLEPVPFSLYLDNLNSNTENFTRVGIEGHANKRWVLMRLGGDFLSNPDGTFGGRNVVLATEFIYFGFLICEIVAELEGDFDTAEFCGSIVDDMNTIDSFWNTLTTTPGDSTDGIVQGSSQIYAGATARYVIGGADSHVGATRSDKARNMLINALDQQFFVPRAGCTFLLSPSSTSFAGAGGNGSLTINTAINTPTACSWSAVSDVPWITLPAGTHGVGSGTISYTVAPNPSTTSSRTGTINISGLIFTLTQTAGPDFTLSVTPSSLSVGTGGTTSYSVSGSALNGFNASVSLSVAVSPAGPNPSLSAGSITINGSGSTTSTLSVTTGSTPPGSYAITVTGTGGGVTHSVAVALNIVFPDFTLSIDPNQTVDYPLSPYQQTINYGVTFQGGLNGNVSLSLSQDFCSTGGVYSLSQNTFTSSGTGTFTVWIFDPTGSGAGFYECYRLTGTQNGVSKMVGTEIFVNPAPPPPPPPGN